MSTLSNSTSRATRTLWQRETKFVIEEAKKRELLRIIDRCHRKRMMLLRSGLHDTEEYKANDVRDKEALKEFRKFPKYDGPVRW